MPRSSRMPSLPAGFRFHPTDEELIVHYLMKQAASIPCPVPIIAEVNIYQSNPWDLPPKALFGENEWYFFSPRDRKYPNGARPNRAAGSGYWKATGTDKAILSAPASQSIGVKKALVFYRGKPPRGVKTDWIMHEYRLTNTLGGNTNTKRRGSSSSMRLDDWVLCRIYKKSNNFQVVSDQELEQEEGSTVEEDSSLMNSNLLNDDNGAPSPKSETAHDGSNDDGDHHHQFRPLSMTKSCSLTDLLNTIDYSTLSQLLLDAPPPETEPPLIYTTPLNNVHYEHGSNSSINDMPQQVDAFCSDHYGANNYNALKRKRVMPTDHGGDGSFHDGSSCFTKKSQVVPISRDTSFGSSSSSSSSYCNNQQQLADAAANHNISFQYNSLLLSHPFLNQQLLLSNHHLEMQ